VVNRIDAQKVLGDAGISAGDLQKVEVLPKMSASLGIDAFLSGTLALTKKTSTLSLSLIDVASRRELYNTVYKENVTPGFEGYFPAVSDPTGRLFYFGGLDGLSQPKCIRCPDPAYSDRAGSAKIQGSITLSILLTAEGRIQDIKVIQGLERSLDDTSIRTVLGWKLDPVRDADGNAVPVRLPLEVTFRLF
jgi:TonB family protein